MIVSVFVFAILAQYLGPDQFGVLSYAIAVIALVTPVLTLGLNRPVVRHLIEERLEARSLMLSVFFLRLTAAVILILLIVAGLKLHTTTELAERLIVVTAVGLLFQPFEVIALWYESQVRSRFIIFAKSAAFAIASSVKLVLVVNDAPLAWFAWSNVLELALGAAFSCAVYFAQTAGAPAARFVPRTVAAMLGRCWPAIPAAFGTAVCMRLDQVMLEHLSSFAAVGVYAAGSRLSDAWFFVPGAVATSAFPTLIANRSSDRDQYERNLGRLFLLVYFVALAIVIPTFVFGGWLVSFLYGAEFTASAAVLKLHILSLIPVAFGQASGLWIYTEWRISLDLYRALLGAATNVMLNLLLIPRYGPQGAAAATVASLVVAYYLFDLLVPSMRPMFAQKSRALVLVDAPAELRHQVKRVIRWFSVLRER